MLIIESYVLMALAKEWESQAVEQLPDNALGDLARKTVRACASDLRRVVSTWSFPAESEEDS